MKPDNPATGLEEMQYADPIMFQNAAREMKAWGDAVEAHRQAQDKHDREWWAKTYPDQPYPFPQRV
jgi:hypothetical protein